MVSDQGVPNGSSCCIAATAASLAAFIGLSGCFARFRSRHLA
jgi:hypothetical protein